MTTYYSYRNLSCKVVSCTPTPSDQGYFWHSYCLNSDFSSVCIDHASFLPPACSHDAIAIDEVYFNHIKNATLAELNLMVLPLEKVPATVIDLSHL